MTKSTHNQQHWAELAQSSAEQRKTKAVAVDPAHAKYNWWCNPTNSASLRLSTTGYRWFTGPAGLKAHVITLPTIVHSKQLLQLERLFQAPYYLQGHKIICVFGELDAIMLQLHAGNLAQYLDNLQM